MVALTVTGGLTGAAALELPNSPGAIWLFDLTGLALNGKVLSFAVPGGSTAASIPGTGLQSGQTGVVVGVSASGVVTRYS